MFCKPMILAAPIRSYGESTNTSMAAYKGSIFVAYADIDGTLTVARRDYLTGVWTKAAKIADTLAVKDASHNQIELAIDGAGYVHVWYGMHNFEGLRYVRSNKPDSVTDGFTVRSNEFPSNTDGYSYPFATTAPNGDLYFTIRHQNRYLPLFHWSKGTWRKVATFVDGSPTLNDGKAYVPYFPWLYVSPDGNVHIKWEWAQNKARGERHHGCYAMYKPSDGKFYRADGQACVLPITVNAADVLQPQPDGVSWDGEGIALGDIAIESGNRPVVSYAFSPDGKAAWEHRVARWDGTKWTQVTLTDRISKWHRSFLVSTPRWLYCYMRTVEGTEMCYSTDQGRSWSTPRVVHNRALDGVVALTSEMHALLHLGLDARNIDTDISYLQIG